MLGKLLNPFRQSRPAVSSSALKLVHPGGRVERYYMAMSAAKLMERYPSFFIATPDVFKQPWDSIVPPDEVLFPGQKFFLVPQRTVKKLRRRIQKPLVGLSSFGAADVPSISISSTSSRSAKVSKTKISAKKCFGIDKSEDFDQSLDFSRSIKTGSSSSSSSKSRGRKVVQVAAWHPALESISEM